MDQLRFEIVYKVSAVKFARSAGAAEGILGPVAVNTQDESIEASPIPPVTNWLFVKYPIRTLFL